jgi:hypothetical protein
VEKGKEKKVSGCSRITNKEEYMIYRSFWYDGKIKLGKLRRPYLNKTNKENKGIQEKRIRNKIACKIICTTKEEKCVQF